MGIGQQARMVRCAVLWHRVTECARGGGGAPQHSRDGQPGWFAGAATDGMCCQAMGFACDVVC